MKSIQQKYIINAPLAKVWQALVDPSLIEDWGGGPAKMGDQAGFEFELWGGDIYGKNIEVVPQSKLVQEWTAGEWNQPSKVTLTLSGKGNKTTVELLHEDVPDGETLEFEDGWKTNYLGPLKEYAENFL
ncbi:hypothetical protein A3B45_04190 [Candidatus Daviesbacteria bacterium RIFCSPLOWO2_01_FULL_39_12]|uniref:Activator of Hsp90 ATPase homologue 1/2-like C-terminal domain-containing protein n=1 Tax=Candidatus Daviesbacteria bacterium RIFCSPLOWO2_01_FULL_39_12 TaxID=1797785 RepID=A0A1F5KTH6_9BACT|nr:MAG: hypothetical protein A3B45_04190 [Candidatus Daviesbacteria bacterium RIFCSPLOWO2_01_FULL_39_12]